MKNNSVEVNKQELEELEASICKLVGKVKKQDVELEELRTFKKLIEQTPTKNLFETLQSINEVL